MNICWPPPPGVLLEGTEVALLAGIEVRVVPVAAGGGPEEPPAAAENGTDGCTGVIVGRLII